ncbi:MAG: penicillin-binding protein activator [Proteobacteria bacterium]|nr:penicillin-binding protein activator [Pseudomonadota bacterium]
MKRLLYPALLAALIAGCASVGDVEQTAPQSFAADRMLVQNHPREAARAYEAQVASADGRLRSVLLIRAANAWQVAGDHVAARRDFAQVDPKHLAGTDGLRFRLLRAEFAIADGRPAQAVGDLHVNDALIPAELAPRWHRAHALALEASGDRFGAATALALLEPLEPRHQTAATRQHIRKLLQGVDNGALERGAAALPAGHPLYADAAHALLARGLPLPRPLPASAAMLNPNRPPADDDGYRPPLKVALLLPTTGSVAIAGAAVRDGFMTAYYAEQRRRPEIKVYDSSESAGGAVDAYRKAVADGCDYVVGPLGRDQVGALFNQGSLPVPVLALNRSDKPAPPGSEGFSLAPEDEGVAIAERLRSKHAQRVIVFASRDETATRALAAFRDAFAQRGGSIAAEATIADNGPDYGPILKDTLAKAGGQYDAIVIALRAPAARMLAAQLPDNGYKQVPRLATSLILSGGGNARLDQELDGIEYPELAWLLHPVNGLPDATSLGSKLPSARGGGLRLFAFGADAWRLAAYMDALASNPQTSVSGATGDLHVDGLGNVIHDSAWAVFAGGRGRPVQDSALQLEPSAPSAPGAH